MFRIRLVYSDELVTWARLFFLTEGRNLLPEDYVLENGYIVFKSNISVQLEQIFQRVETETIWAPIWVEGLAKGFFSDQTDTAAKLAGLDVVPEINW